MLESWKKNEQQNEGNAFAAKCNDQAGFARPENCMENNNSNFIISRDVRSHYPARIFLWSTWSRSSILYDGKLIEIREEYNWMFRKKVDGQHKMKAAHT